MRRLMKLAAIAASATGAIVMNAGDARAQSPQDVLDQFDRQGPCRVEIMNAQGARLYVPTCPGETQFQGRLLWGNGTGGNAGTYQGMLERVASFGIPIGAATTANSGQGREIVAAGEALNRALGDRLAANARTCIAGHSQGGGGANNASIQTPTNCIINVETDATFTIRIAGPTAEGADSLLIGGTNDNLAPLQPTNEPAVRANARGRIALIEIEGITHFEPVGAPNQITPSLAAFAAGQLRSDELATQAKAIFEPGPNAISTENVRGLARAEPLTPTAGR